MKPICRMWRTLLMIWPFSNPLEVGNGDDIEIDNMTYEEINQLEESMGEEKSKGLSEDLISMLPSHKYKKPSTKGSKSSEKSECLICKMEYKRGDMITTLPCTHQYHETCIKNWLQESKSCCLCKTEVTL
ncbi:E3 ubiquitin-protein ligase BIG BROTHER-like [Tripterygium wilfordii]|uniref:E3 ubiquitin-protein ligase BIG BROTHER-like n=1 Tax=Tripterygium wilfordii TaxID=458696 RepID=UPI0018F80CE3|nr:E3 ubiquitin-protein ligase BIG BROTHER-like [Tripterygium wilfordii]XP_038685650.1 E3 ubiquitin-protein ligase BIG BROTHER-like [Tripterygium wilfordii]